MTRRHCSGAAGRLYVYALVDRKCPRVKLHGRTIDCVPVGDIFAFAQRIDRAPAMSEEALREQHDVVLELAARARAILPARFGSIVDEEELRRILVLRAVQFTAAFDLVRGREQMTVRLLGGADGVEPPAHRDSAALEGGPGARYLEERRAAAGYPLPDAVSRLTSAVRDMIFAEKAEPGQSGVRAMLYHLIERGGSAGYCRALAGAAAEVEPFTVRVTGPWPPFAFTPELLG
jgi:hypothetical protein